MEQNTSRAQSKEFGPNGHKWYINSNKLKNDLVRRASNEYLTHEELVSEEMKIQKQDESDIEDDL